MCKKRNLETMKLDITPCTWACKWVPWNCPKWKIWKENIPEGAKMLNSTLSEIQEQMGDLDEIQTTTHNNLHWLLSQ